MTNEDFIKSISLEGEIWKDVVDYEGHYKVSDFGRVCSLQRKISVGNGGWRILQPKILHSHPIKLGNYNRYCVSLWKDNSVSKKKIHRLVAEAFIPNPENYSEIDHIDTDTSNNHINNLRWCNRKMNANNPITIENSRHARLGNPIPKLQKPIVQLLNGSLIRIFPSIKSTTEIGFNKNQISLCCNNLRKSHKGFQWMFLSDYEALTNKSKNDLPNPN